MNKDKLKKLISRFDGLEEETSQSFQVIENDLSELVKKMKSEVTIKTLDTVNQELNKIKKAVDFSPIASQIQSLKEEIATGFNSVREDATELKDDYLRILDKFGESIKKYDELNKSISTITGNIQNYLKEQSAKDKEIINSVEETKETIAENKTKTDKSLKEISDGLVSSTKDIKNIANKNKKETEEIRELVNTIRMELLSKISSSQGGGNMNRKISTNGTVISTKYTDINFKGSGITYSASDNNTTKQVDLTLTASGSGTPGGNTTELQYNNAGSFGGITGATSDGTSVTLTSPKINENVAVTATATELNYTDGVTSAIQTQLDGKANTALSNLASVAVNTTLVSDTDNTDDLGTTSVFWRTGYFKTSIELGATDTTLTRSSAGVLAVEGVVVPTISSTNTLTNKRITKRVVVAADATSITPNTDNADWTEQANTQSTGTLTINADGGTPTNKQPWGLEIKSTNVQTFSWNAQFVGGTTALPTSSTGSSKIDFYSFVYSTTNNKWIFTGSQTNVT